MPVLKRVGIVSVAKITAVIGIVIGLIMGIIIGLISTLFGSIFDMMGPEMMGGAGFGALGLLAIVILPIVYGIGGFIYGAVVAAIYNIIARIIGGIVLEFEG
jgi:hypothetical protein